MITPENSKFKQSINRVNYCLSNKVVCDIDGFPIRIGDTVENINVRPHSYSKICKIKYPYVETEIEKDIHWYNILRVHTNDTSTNVVNLKKPGERDIGKEGMDTTGRIRVYVARQPERYKIKNHWGNPFALTTAYAKMANVKIKGKHEDVCDLFEKWFLNDRHPFYEELKPAEERRIWMIKNLHNLIGKTLTCFCKPKRCHADTLEELANKLQIVLTNTAIKCGIKNSKLTHKNVLTCKRAINRELLLGFPLTKKEINLFLIWAGKKEHVNE